MAAFVSPVHSLMAWVNQPVGGGKKGQSEHDVAHRAICDELTKLNQDLEECENKLADCWDVDLGSISHQEQAIELRGLVRNDLEIYSKGSVWARVSSCACWDSSQFRLTRAEEYLQQYRESVQSLSKAVSELEGKQVVPRFSDDVVAVAAYQPPKALERVVKHLRSPVSCPRVLVHGSAGMGKSSLATHLLDCWLEDGTFQKRYVDGAYIINLGTAPDFDNETYSDEEVAKLEKLYLIRFYEELQRRLQYKPQDVLPLHKARPIPRGALHLHKLNDLESSLANLKQCIQTRLLARRFLLILDNMWPEYRSLLTESDSGLFSTDFHGAVVVLSHDRLSSLDFPSVTFSVALESGRSVAEAIFSTYTYGSSEETAFRPQHKRIGKHVVAQVEGSPLALRLLGSALRTGATTWRKVRSDVDGLADSWGYNASKIVDLAMTYTRAKLAEDRDGVECMFAALRLFPPTARVPVSVLKAVWCAHDGCDPGTFARHLSTLERAAIIERHDPVAPALTDTVSVHALILNHLKHDPDVHTHRLRPSSKPLTLKSPALAAYCCIRLVGTLSAANEARAALKKVQLLPEERPRVGKPPWWDLFSKHDSYSLDVGALLDARFRPDPTLVTELLFSAATGRLWPALASQLPRLLANLDTVNMALALIVGTGSAAAAVKGTWGQHHTDAVEELLESAGRLEGAAAQAAAHVLVHVWKVLVNDLGEHELALKVSQVALQLRQDSLGHSDPWTLRARRCVALSMHGCGNTEQALDMFESLREMLVHSLKSSPPGRDPDGLKGNASDGSMRNYSGEEHKQQAMMQEEMLKTMGDMARCMGRLNHRTEALRLARDAYAGLLESAGEADPLTISALRMVSWALYRSGHVGEAKQTFQQVAKLRERVFGSCHLYTLISKAELGVGHTGLNEHKNALSAKERVLKTLEREQVVPPDHPMRICLERSIAVSLSNLGRHAEALFLDRAVLEARERRSKSMCRKKDRDLLISRFDVGLDLYHLGDTKQALEQLEETLKQAEAGLEAVDIVRLERSINVCRTALQQADAAAPRQERQPPQEQGGGVRFLLPRTSSRISTGTPDMVKQEMRLSGFHEWIPFHTGP